MPYIGAIVAGAFAVILALGAQGTAVAVAMLVVVLLANGLLQNLFQPFAMGSALGLNPLVVLVVTIGAGCLFGMLGLVLAAPLVSAATKIARELAPTASDRDPERARRTTRRRTRRETRTGCRSPKARNRSQRCSASRAPDLGIPGDVHGALEDLTVPSYAVDSFGIIRWLNPAAIALIGDARGRQQSSVVAPEQARAARESFTRKVLGTEKSTDAEVVLVAPNGTADPRRGELRPAPRGRADRRRLRRDPAPRRHGRPRARTRISRRVRTRCST